MKRSYPLAVVVAFIAACEKQNPTPELVEAAPQKVATAERCVGEFVAGAAEKLEVGGVTWEIAGSTLKRLGDNKKVTIGAITDIKEDSPENLANLRNFIGWFKQKNVDVVVVAGDTGLDQKQIESSLNLLATTAVPVLTIIGNREGVSDFNKAIANVRKKHSNVVSLNRVRRVETGAVDIVSMPGYYSEHYLHADDGCLYTKTDVASLTKAVGSSKSPVLLVSHGGPRQDGENAIDRIAEGENVGDPELASVLKGQKVAFGIFGNVHEAGGRATDLSGKTVLKQGQAYGSMYLNPGPADAVRWAMNDGTESGGMAAVMTVENGKATYAISRAKLN